MTRVERTVVFLDLARFTTLTDVHGDSAAVDVLDRFLACVDGALEGQAVVVKTLGEGVLLVVESPSTGAAVAARVVERLHDEVGLPDVAGGIHHGPVLLRDGNVLGATVNLASRLADAAPPAELYATERPAHAAANAALLTRPLGAIELPGVIHVVEVYAISPCDHRADETRVDPVCGMRILPAPETLRHDDDGGTFWFCARRQRPGRRHLARAGRLHRAAPPGQGVDDAHRRRAGRVAVRGDHCRAAFIADTARYRA